MPIEPPVISAIRCADISASFFLIAVDLCYFASLPEFVIDPGARYLTQVMIVSSTLILGNGTTVLTACGDGYWGAAIKSGVNEKPTAKVGFRVTLIEGDVMGESDPTVRDRQNLWLFGYYGEGA